MRKKVTRPFLAAIVVLAVAGCGPVISQNTISTVDRNIAFPELVKNPSAHIGKLVLFGGEIISVENRETETVIEVLHESMNRRLRPSGAETSEGRFMAVFKGFKDPEIYSRGRLLTVAGVVKGGETRRLGKMDYNYPVIEATEYYLWRQRMEPSFGIGIGVGVSHGF